MVASSHGPLRPGLAHAERRQRRAFTEWARSLAAGGEAADAFAAAYAALPPPHRVRLARAIAADLRARGDAPGPAIARLFAIEADADVAHQLMAMLAEWMQPLSVGLAARAGEHRASALLRPTSRASGDALIVRRLGDDIVAVSVEAYDSHQALERRLGAMLPGASPRWRPHVEVRDEIAAPLFRYVRGGGDVPPEARAFSSLFGD